MNPSERQKRFYTDIVERCGSLAGGKLEKEYRGVMLRTVGLSDGDYVLDAGCGDGMLLREFCDNFCVAVYGTDSSEDNLAEARKNCPTGHFIASSDTKLPFCEGFFDVVTCTGFDRIDCPDLFLKQAKKVLCDGGRLYAAGLKLPEGVKKTLNTAISAASYKTRIYSMDELAVLMHDCGFTQIRVFSKGSVMVVCGTRPARG